MAISKHSQPVGSVGLLACLAAAALDDNKHQNYRNHKRCDLDNQRCVHNGSPFGW
jgi:hypothetical protein